MKRFWKNSNAHLQGDSYQVLLDERRVKLPSGAVLTVPFAGLAEAIAKEWSAVGSVFTPNDLPLTQLVCTAQERVVPHRQEIICSLVAYGLNDLLCYRADSPQGLVARQHAEWDPWLNWLETVHDIGLITTKGLMPVNQLSWTEGKLEALLARQTDYELAALGVLIPGFGSFVLGVAASQGAITPEQACAAASLDELWQAEQWSEDPEDTAKRQVLCTEVKNTIHFLELVRV